MNIFEINLFLLYTSIFYFLILINSSTLLEGCGKVQLGKKFYFCKVKCVNIGAITSISVKNHR